MNPYEVLGVPENADEETVKKAYKELVKKYHPDKYVNNPLADLAAEKMKEVNQAYDAIMKKGTTSQASGGYGGYGGYGNRGGYTGATPSFSTVRQMLTMGMTMQALMMLQNLPKTAEWYFLSGLANIKSGRYTDGISFLETAVRMEPNNTEYSDTLNSVKNRANSYNTGGGMYSSGGGCPLPCLCLPCMCGGPCPGPCC
ncbi:MAG: J domain-containing protein [Clostridia bacterium]|nr:J domain-containing protein [Clostridia bacterium]